MNRNFSYILLFLCITGFVVNHFFIDWSAYNQSRAHESLEKLIVDQHTDLTIWSHGMDGSVDFQKRKLCKGRLVDWSDNKPFASSISTDSLQIIANELGIFLIQKMKQGECIYTSSHRLYEDYSIANSYLSDRVSARLSDHIQNLNTQRGGYTYKDLIYYDVDTLPSTSLDALVALWILIVLIVEWVRLVRKSQRTFLIALVILLFVRGLTLYFDVGYLVVRYPLFDPLQYTSSVVNPTLGDLLINCLLLFGIVLLAEPHIRSIRKSRWRVAMLCGVSTVLSGIVLHVAWSIISNSQLSLDVASSIRFYSLRWVAYLCIVLTGMTYFYFVYLVIHTIRRNHSFNYAISGTLVAAMVLGAVDLLSISFSLIHVTLLLIALRYGLGNSLRKFSYSNVLFILFSAMGVATVLSFCVYKYEEGAMIDAKKKFANYLLLKRDVLGEYYLHQTIQKISSDAQLEEIASEGERSTLENSIYNYFLTPYFNKYEFEIVFQDYQQLRLNTRYTKEFSLLTPQSQSDYENIYFIDEGTSFKYICKVNLGDLVSLIILKIKKRVPSSVYPALLTDNKFFSFNNDFDYAVFAGDEILFHRSKFGRGEWPSTKDFELDRLYRGGLERNERHYLGVKTTDGRTILIISDTYEVRDRLINFSFFFLLLLICFGMFSFFRSVLHDGLQASFTGKIQLYLGLAFIIPLLIAGIALINSLNTSYREEINRSYIKQALYISEMLSNEIDQFDEKTSAQRLAEISSYIRSDLTYYNASGYLIATSQPEIFNLDLLSGLINPVVFDELVTKENQSMIADESVGKLDYKVCYATVSTIDNQVAGFIAMPFFDSKNHLRRQQIEVFGNLITIFSFIVILAIVFGNAILNNLLRPLRMVAEKIRKVTLEELNEPIRYESSDEIGSLVNDYNQMVLKLEESKRALAKSQKETAWKEIARQVAHEIKNPLTPMQLKIQQMLRRYGTDTKEYDTLTSLLTQVDTLSQIATSFSAFAEMPAPDNQVFDWSKLVQEVVELYRSQQVTIQTDIEPGIRIDADPDIFRRILNNIVLNAIQAVEEKPAQISIALQGNTSKCTLSVEDNGKGVSEELKDKIFLNYFSTKREGSGIGLALAKKGIENAGGHIWFESKEGEGTTFFISMPLADR